MGTLSERITLAILGLLETQEVLKRGNREDMVPLVERRVYQEVAEERETVRRFLRWWGQAIHLKHHAPARDWSRNDSFERCQEAFCLAVSGTLVDLDNEAQGKVVAGR